MSFAATTSVPVEKSRADRPILFSGPMIRAILAGTKTQTRRLMRDQPCCDSGIRVERYNPGVMDRFGNLHPGPEIFGAYCGNGCDWGTVSPFGPGDRLWVRETWGLHRYTDITDWHRGTIRGSSFDDVAAQWAIAYAASGSPNSAHWRPSIHMPRWASRITLEVTDVRVERLQDISAEDAISEGLSKLSKDGGQTWKYGIPDRDGLPGGDDDGMHWRDWSQDPRMAFDTAWSTINGKRATWSSNPWVWVVEFRRVT